MGAKCSLEAQCKGCVLLGAIQEGSGDELIMQHKKVSLGAEVHSFSPSPKQCSAATPTGRVSVPQVSIKSKL